MARIRLITIIAVLLLVPGAAGLGYLVGHQQGRNESSGQDMGEDGAADYLNIFLKHPRVVDNARPITAVELDRRLEKIRSGYSEPAPDLKADALRRTILQQLNMEFLMPRLAQVKPCAYGGEVRQVGNHLRQMVYIHDEYIGRLRGILLTPKGEGPFPAVVVVHGHSDTAERYLERWRGADFAERGYVALVLNMRANEGNEIEDRVTRSLLLQGHSFMTVRVYEMVLGLRYLEQLPSVARGRVGLIGQSGGGVAGNLAVRLGFPFRAYVTDCNGSYYNVTEDEGTLLDENLPGLHPHGGQINDLSTLALPALQVEYGLFGSEAGMRKVLAFFDRHLKPVAPAARAPSQGPISPRTL